MTQSTPPPQPPTQGYGQPYYGPEYPPAGYGVYAPDYSQYPDPYDYRAGDPSDPRY